MPKGSRRLWSATEDQLLLALRKAGVGCKTIGKRFDRSIGSIRSRIGYLAREARIAARLRREVRRIVRRLAQMQVLDEDGLSAERFMPFRPWAC